MSAACGNDHGVVAPSSPVGDVPAFDQRTGDPANGWRALIEEGYVGCGVPLTAYRKVFNQQIPASYRLPERTGANAELPYNMTAFTTASGVEVVTPNCLQCHAQHLEGQLVIGLGNHTSDFTQDVGFLANAAGGLVEGDAERAEWQRWRDRMVAIAPHTITRTIGVNPADNLAAVLFAHRDVDTLAWSDEPLMPLPPQIVVPVDVPPWWHMQKKHAMFYVGAGRGDHARIMMTASTLCVDTVEEARQIDAYFPDVRSFLLTLKAPAYPHEIDAARAAAGKTVFEASCARCHGTYGESETYPNTIIALDEVGTDRTLAQGAGQFAARYLNWFNASFFGELSHLAPAPGYIAPPLDGIWATAPYLHNGSVPTLRALLDSTTRPKFFRRSPGAYDRDAVGWRFTALASATPPPGADANEVYDTTQLGYGNGGHTFGDALAPADRDALIEYLKTL
ncbi:MAG: c-type cytochrome [Deltaproteobacteria bacterium]|nr:c-type cytochrome [Deltaproteobacteria bacterium]